MRRLRLVPALVTLGLVGSALVAGPAAAAPVDDDDVAAAHAAVEDASAAVARIELELAVQQGELGQAWTAVAVAAEDYTQARVASEQARSASLEAAARSAEADDAAEQARQELGSIALAAYRSGGQLDMVGALLTADGLEDLVARGQAFDRLGQQADRAVQRLEAAQLVADTLQQHADDASAKAATAAGDARRALATAQQAQSDAQAKVAQVEADRETLIAELADARQTSVEVERARQAQLDADRQARQEAAARAAHASAGGTGSASGTGSTTGTGSGGPTTPPVTTPTTPTTPVTNPPVTNPPVTNPPVVTPTPTPTPSPTPDPTPAPAPPTGTQRGSAAQGEAAVAWALSQVGKPYGYGDSGPSSFDCSGLTMRSWQAAGVSLMRTSRDQYRQVAKIDYDSLRPGDLIFYGTDPNTWSSVYHVAMYIGGGQMVEAPKPGLSVRVVPMRWSSTMAYAGRP